jgi:Xaa-Pro aminopeptidase
MKKTANELINIEHACKICDLCLKEILRTIKEGVSEKELAKKITLFLKANSDGIAFRSIVAFGENSNEIHHKVTGRKLKNGDVIMLDFGAKVNKMCSDITRTFFFGKITKEQRRTYNIVLSSQKKAIEYINSRFKIHDACKAYKVDEVARKYLKNHGLDLPHSLGHGVGRKVHQSPKISPKSKSYLGEGFVFTIEPGVYLRTFGVRIEDTVTIEKGRVKTLTNFPKEIIVIK